MSGAGPEDAGLASGLANVAVQMGGALGVAALASLSTIRTRGLLTTAHPANDALLGGYDLGFGCRRASVALAVVVALVVLRAAPGTWQNAGVSLKRAA